MYCTVWVCGFNIHLLHVFWFGHNIGYGIKLYVNS